MGTGKTKQKCQNYIQKHNLEQHIQIIEGNFTDLITKVDLFVLATHYEGLPLVLCEAMASHTPIIATNVPGVNEIVINNKTGLLVKENDIYDLAQSILKMRSSTNITKQIIENANKFLYENFTLKIMYNNYKKEIENDKFR